ncbi:MAG: DsbA family protein [Nitrosopumilus sp.]|nr:DsbA family protein [Nitrosopumilus sp.]MDF2423150.1 DsbA family protein [Nitrosopumilus sp.]MDF2424136.1 DsbA family protein [Nitrosopumilus sp.]MDF2425991.1 DsbA family protein [Nitrosopumilus sp.]MDF2427539.1 DsbA family protein [Nitrosopumilus sp.]
MTKLYLLAIPVIIGIIAGAFLSSYLEAESKSDSLTASKLIEGGSPIMGSPNAPITILEWGDYQCTFCYKFHQSTLDIINEDFVKTGKVKIVFKDFPLNGPDSLLAAEATHCAQDQEKYWQYHDELYDNWGGERTGWVTRESLGKFAITVNLDLDKFNKCLDDHKYQNKVMSLHEFGKKIGIDATPSFLVFNGEKMIKIRGNQPLEVFLKTFDEL